MTLYQWMVYHERAIAFDRCTWMGVQTFKNPFDTWIYQEILYEVQPDIVIEIGSAHGGSTLYLAHLLDLIGKGVVISIDIDRSTFSVTHPRIILLTGDSASAEVLTSVRALCLDKSVLLIHDGNHTKIQVLRDIDAYAPLISIKSYMIIEDGIIDLFTPLDDIGATEPGPLSAIDHFLRYNPHFVIDRTRERYIVTYNPRGFLKRVR